MTFWAMCTFLIVLGDMYIHRFETKLIKQHVSTKTSLTNQLTIDNTVCIGI